jgi:DNA-binding SARP family transcriptional activator/tetratricopeptide (TPR) repeat protein
MGGKLKFLLLGPLEVWAGDTRVRLFGPRQEKVLAALLLDANRHVSLDRLVDVVWDNDPPPTARRQVQDLATRLRRTLATVGASDELLVTERAGYRLCVADEHLDTRRFENMVAQARGVAADNPELASAILHTALTLFRGSTLADVGSGALAMTAANWDERRLAVWEDCIALDLQLGRHCDVVGELKDLVDANPFRERLVGLLMQALTAAGQRAEALDAYHQLRHRLAEGLGIDPGKDLQTIFLDVIRSVEPPGDEAPAPAKQPGRPAQLPADIVDFVGREAQLESLDALAGQSGAIALVTGTAGVGKTALAVHWAHRIVDQFRDGQLYVDLRGYDPRQPVRPIDALAGFLRALGVPSSQVPIDEDEASALFRTVLVNRRVLVVLDNARSAHHVQSLLPGGSGCMSLVTSRDRLGALVARNGARRVPLDVLPVRDAVALIRAIVGPDIVDSDPDAAELLARRCAHLPLALRVSAANLLDHSGRTLAEHAEMLAGRQRFAELSVDDGEVAVGAALDQSYATLPGQAQRLYRLLGLVPGPDVTVEAVAALADEIPAHARDLLDRLISAHLVDPYTPGRYRQHDLLRAHAASLADRRNDQEAISAVERLFAWYVATAGAAVSTLYPHVIRLPSVRAPAVDGPDRATALAWLDAEILNLVAAADYAADHAPHSVAWRLSDILRSYCPQRGITSQWLRLAAAGSRAAEQDGDLQAKAAALLCLGQAEDRAAHYAEAKNLLTRSHDLADEAGWRPGVAAATQTPGAVHLTLGDARAAAALFRRAVSGYRGMGALASAAATLNSLALARYHLGDLTEADAHLDEAMTYETDPSPVNAALHLNAKGDISYHLGHLHQAEAQLSDALATYRQTGARHGEAFALGMLALVHTEFGQHDLAFDEAREAADLVQSNEDPHTKVFVLNMVGEVHRAAGRYPLALDCHREALRLATAGHRRGEIGARIGLAQALHDIYQLDEALAHANRAAEQSRDLGYRILEGRALTASAAIQLARGSEDAAARSAARALRLHTSTGHRLGIARTLLILARTAATRPASERLLGQARETFDAMGAPMPIEPGSNLRERHDEPTT